MRIYKNVRAGLPDGTEPTPAEQSTIDQLIGALNSAVEQAEDAEERIENMSVSATTLAEGASATVTKSEQDGVVHLAFGIPKGQTGDDGYSPTANVSKTGKVATITITDKNGTTSAQVEDGTDGIDGISPSVSVTDITGGHRVVITDKDGAKSFDVEDGATGATPNLTIGTVETLDPTDDATATITGTPENPVLNLGIPQGEQGEVTFEEFYKAFPTDTASGAIASFTDGADDLPLKSLVVDINPVQDLSHGDPSPENICPISGWTGCKVQRTGKNLCDANNLASTPTPIGDRHGVTISKAGTYTIHSDAVGMGNAYIYAYPVNADGTYGALKYIVAGTVRTATTITITDGVKLIVVDAARANSMAASKALFESWQIQIELGSIATPYEPYTGRSITINLGQTVYGGKLDVLSGELTVYPYYASYNGETLTGEWISDRDKYVSGTTPTIGAQVVNIGAQGVTVQLEPHEVESLYGVNNLWADSGDTEVEYRADTKLFIERLTAPDSADMIADSNITSGQYFMVGNSLYKATANIANGSAIIVGTNCTRKSLSEALNEINA